MSALTVTRIRTFNGFKVVSGKEMHEELSAAHCIQARCCLDHSVHNTLAPEGGRIVPFQMAFVVISAFLSQDGVSVKIQDYRLGLVLGLGLKLVLDQKGRCPQNQNDNFDF